MAFSVNTNTSAFVALQNLNATNRDLAVTQNRVSTGLKVSSAKDDAATYAIAQNLRADVGGFNAVKDSLNRAKSALDVGISAAESISDTLIEMKEKAVAAADTSLDADSRQALEDDFNSLSKQLASYVDQAEFNGTNLLKDGGQNISAILDADATSTLSVANQGLNTATTGELASFINAAGVSIDADWSTGGAAAGTSQTAVDTAIKAMNTVLSNLGSASSQIDGQLDFVSKLSDTIEGGIGNLVDADLAKESANLTALQTKQQLGTQALTIANQMPQSILSLFQG